MIKTRNRRNTCLNTITATYGRPVSRIILRGGEQIENIFSKIKNETRHFFFISSNIVIGMLTRTIRQEKEIKVYN